MRTGTMTILSILAVTVLSFCAVLSLYSFADTQDVGYAENISASVEFKTQKILDPFNMHNDWQGVASVGREGATVELISQQTIGGIYVIFDSEYGEWQVTDIQGKTCTQTKPYIHQYFDVAEAFGGGRNSLTLTFPEEGVGISEIYVFGLGECPEWVQRWEPTPEYTDILLISTHSDDEHLFFAGIIPYYTAEGRIVTVAYMTEHYSSSERHHERLNGLWTAGLRNYPIFGGFTDRYSTDIKWAENNLVYDGHTMDELDAFTVELIRRTRPKVLFTHDFEGEYGHGQHRLLAASAARALECSADGDVYPESAHKYGVYDVPKAYFHLWGEGQIRFDWDAPLESLGGKSPFEVSREAYKCHNTQWSSWFTEWIFGTESAPIERASDIVEYSPLCFGLYRSTVGADSGKGDVFEHVTPYSDVEHDLTEDDGTQTLPPPPETDAVTTLPDTAPDESTVSVALEDTAYAPADTSALKEEDGDGVSAAVIVLPTVAVCAAICLFIIKRKIK